MHPSLNLKGAGGNIVKIKAYARLAMAGAVATTLATTLAACGGGGSGSAGSGTSIPTLNVSLSSSSGSASATEGATSANLTTTATASGSVSTPVVANLQFDNTVFSSVTATAGATAGTYTVTAQTLPNLGGGEYKGNITFRLCEDTGCNTVYAGSTVTYAYDIVVNLKDWQTYQRDNAHTGFVHATLDPTKFAKAWQWSPAISSAISPVVTGNGRIYFTVQQPSTTTIGKASQLTALNETDGSLAFNVDLGTPYSVGLPSVYNGIAYVGGVSTSETGVVTAYDAASGAVLKNFAFPTQWTQPYQPTVNNGNIFFEGGEFFTALYDFNYATGATTWTGNTVSMIMGSSVNATDGTSVYYYNGTALQVFNAADGTLAKQISDPYQNWNGYDFDSGVMLGATNDAVAYSGTTSFPTNTLNGEHYNARPLVSYGMTTNAITWKGSNAYYTNPAISNKVIYVARNNSSSLDAVNEADGTILWSWTPPAGEVFHRNTIVTDNLVFVSTDKAVYAISLTDHTSKWSYPMPGTLSLSANFMLYISADYIQVVPGASTPIVPARSLGQVVAIKLR